MVGNVKGVNMDKAKRMCHLDKPCLCVCVALGTNEQPLSTSEFDWQCSTLPDNVKWQFQMFNVTLMRQFVV